MDIYQDEIFGPVLAVIRYRDLDDAIRMANDSPFGLGAAIWSNNPKTLFKAGRALDAGTVWMNTNVISTMEAPFGGNKNSGIGREYGAMGIREVRRLRGETGRAMWCGHLEAEAFSDIEGFPGGEH